MENLTDLRMNKFSASQYCTQTVQRMAAIFVT